jgi:cation transport ATPase
MKPAPGVEGSELLRLAASADQMSKHPNARALVAVAHKARLNLTRPDQFEECARQGVSATIMPRHGGRSTGSGKQRWSVGTE